MRRLVTVALSSALSAHASQLPVIPGETDKTCTALVMSGGGSNGAWESGALWGLLHYGNPADYRYDVVTGVSIGSINAAGLSVFEIGNELEAVDFIYKTWNRIRSEDIYTESVLGMAGGLLSPSFYDNTVGLSTMKKLLSQFDGYKRAISLSAVNVETGQVVNLTNENTLFEDLHKAVIASASVPGFFPYMELNDMKLVDGMTAYNTNVQEAIDMCRKIVNNDDSRITIDVMICEVEKELGEWNLTGNAWSNYWRIQDIRNRAHSTNALAGVMRAHPFINWRHVIN